MASHGGWESSGRRGHEEARRTLRAFQQVQSQSERMRSAWFHPGDPLGKTSVETEETVVACRCAWGREGWAGHVQTTGDF